MEHGTLAEETFTYAVDTFARQIGFDRRDFLDDDLSAFSEAIPAAARGAARALNDLVAETILGNAGSFWSTNNSNYIEGATTVLSAEGLAQAVQKLRSMKDAEGNILDLQPAVLLCGSTLESAARALLESNEVLRDVSSTDNLPTGNIYKGVATLVGEPRLDDSDFVGASDAAWWLLSAPQNSAIIVAFLGSQPTPMIEAFDYSSDIDRLAMAFRVYHDFGAALGDHRASVKSKGANGG